MEEGEKLDWATAEALAFGSLLCQGNPLYPRECLYNYVLRTIRPM